MNERSESAYECVMESHEWSQYPYRGFRFWIQVAETHHEFGEWQEAQAAAQIAQAYAQAAAE